MEIHDKLKDLKTLDTAAISDALDSLNINGGLTGITPPDRKMQFGRTSIYYSVH